MKNYLGSLGQVCHETKWDSENTLFHFLSLAFHIFALSQAQVVAGSRCNKAFCRKSFYYSWRSWRQEFPECLGVFWPSFQTQEVHLDSRHHIQSLSCLLLPPAWQRMGSVMWQKTLQFVPTSAKISPLSREKVFHLISLKKTYFLPWPKVPGLKKNHTSS